VLAGFHLEIFGLDQAVLLQQLQVAELINEKYV
jgi:hypothetical protein